MENLAAVDLNLLVVLDALLAERSVTRAGARVGLSQPAVSNALARLRALVGDPLLVRAGSAMEPTPRALELAGPVRHALATLGRALSTAPRFDPATSQHTFRVAATDEAQLTLVPPLAARLAAAAPGVDLSLARATSRVEDGLRTGRHDLYVGSWLDIPASLNHHLLRHEPFACVARKGHPALTGGLTLGAFAAAAHVLVTPAERPGSAVDAALADQGVDRRVALRTPHLSVAARVVARTDLLAILPRRVAETFAAELPIDVFTPPLDAPAVPVHLVWHPRAHDHAPQRWLRQQLMDTAAAEDDAAW